MADWKLIAPNGDLVKELDGRPSQIPEGHSLRCEETHRLREGLGNFQMHDEASGTSGVVQMAPMTTIILHWITVDGNDVKTIEKMLRELRSKIGVKTIE